MLIPAKELSESVLSELVLSELKVESKSQLKYINGSFLILKNVEFSTKKQIFFGVKDKLPLGAMTVLSKQKIRKKLKIEGDPYGWYNNQLPFRESGSGEYIYHRGRLIADGLINYIESEEIYRSIVGLENIVILSNWANMGNHDGKKGINHSFIENNLIRILNENDNIKIYYEVKPIFERYEVVPRGLHVQVEIYGEIKKCSGNRHTLNIFIPNVDSRFKVRYKR